MENTLKPTARTWDSFKPTLEQVLVILRPKIIFEYGPGISSQVMGLYPSVIAIDSVEHDRAWFSKWNGTLPDNVMLVYQPNMELYPNTQGRFDRYDLIFIDGREREKCLFIAKERLVDDGVVMLHDAERISYKPMIDSYGYKFYTDDEHTVTLTDSSVAAMKLEALCG